MSEVGATGSTRGVAGRPLSDENAGSDPARAVSELPVGPALHSGRAPVPTDVGVSKSSTEGKAATVNVPVNGVDPKVLDSQGFVDWSKAVGGDASEHAAIADLGARIDHTNLSESASRADIDQLCEQAHRYRLRAVCVRPEMVAHARARLDSLARQVPDRSGHRVKIAAVVDFPDGTASTAAKVAQAKQVVRDGADEIDPVANRALIAEGFAQAEAGERHPAAWRDYRDAIHAVASAAGVSTKVILEASQLRAEGGERFVAKASELAAEGLFRSLAERPKLPGVVSGAGRSVASSPDHMLKTSTGVHGKASPEDATVLRGSADRVQQREAGRPKLNVKIAGGVRNRSDAAGYDAIAGAKAVYGTSGGIGLLHGAGVKSSY
ncbi:MAG: hypothetical protein AAF219_00485 [Myxococcota bacterium]